MKWYWWVIIVFVPLGLVAYFFYQTGKKTNDAMAKAREAKAAKSAAKDTVVPDPVSSSPIVPNE